MDYLPRYTARALADVEGVGEDFESWDKERKAEDGVRTVREGGLRNAGRLWVIKA